ncbi:sulfate adenylyltransferase subunit CysD [Saccharothrix australiensis]|uniref:Sulfate adenylyltransferase subunit 2 n=1 Tax=Saccharothrix australiensis TaxID=2072 RepID=A0A495VWZ1_9PSEU|nr:sulfate adenylyltransferase subunit CysD [Saccharothrix australiensis]RKT53836.1 sulfate adenylyltransferase subunit 2 [Saccharothrix australiensis]
MRTLTRLRALEAEGVDILREVVAEAARPVLLYSMDKDSSVLLHLARKAFHPARPPLPLLHVDTTWQFREVIEFRDRTAARLGLDLIVHRNPECVRLGVGPFTHGPAVHTDMWWAQGLQQALDEHGFDAAVGGARRDGPRSRAAERVFAPRARGREQRRQRPELWDLYNCRTAPDETVRVSPLANWTELDVWEYVAREDVPVAPLYFAAERPVVRRDIGLVVVDDERMPLRPGERPERRLVRVRALGCYPLSAAVESDARTAADIVRETAGTAGRGGGVDHDAVGPAESEEREGCFR